MKAMPSFSQFASDQTAESRHLASCELVEWRVRQSGIGNPGNSAMLLQQLGDGQCRRAMPFHAQFERLQAAQKEESGQRRNSGAGEVAQPMAPDHFDNAFWSRHDAGDKVAMPADELGRRMHDEVGAQEDGLLQCGRGEGVVNDRQGSGLVCDPADGGNVDDPEVRIGRRLKKDELWRAEAYGRFDRTEIREVCHDHFHPKAGQPAHKKDKTVAVEGVIDNHLVSRLQQRP
jgi:hypothetical protein